jgi:hypothetical protein
MKFQRALTPMPMVQLQQLPVSSDPLPVVACYLFAFAKSFSPDLCVLRH